ncbi:hypothetical protein [Streptomyces niveus]|uniref:hypothetical protein n=1 Tax=Streptomyces niveus TaxID=193462 RepID=UPI001F192CF4|nr:hypothetical protein [Streptomyces niveus]
MTEPRSGGALRLPRAWVVPLSAPPSSYTAAVERYLIGAGIAKSSARIYRISLTTWGWMFAGEPAPTGPARHGAKPPVFLIAAIDDPALPEVLAELAAARADEMDADTVNRELSIARKAIGWWQRQGWIISDPTIHVVFEQRPDLDQVLRLPVLPHSCPLAQPVGSPQGGETEPERRSEEHNCGRKVTERYMPPGGSYTRTGPRPRSAVR